RIDEEKRLSREFGTKNKKELWKMETTLKKFKAQAKKLIALKTNQAAVEREHLFRRVGELGLVKSDITYDTILSLTTDDILARRLQSVVVSKGLARTVKQARQFITHEHIIVGDKVITSPSYLVSVKEESQVGFAVSSPYFKEDHPERAVPEAKSDKKKEAEKQPKEVTESAPAAEEAQDQEEPADEEDAQ
ncbi:MAG: 30S ribosomal protein S4, partial [Nanoarchaeota archaeon]|nr:30S ribosomal protein S4 [Nanoarchaeota archaeon]